MCYLEHSRRRTKLRKEKIEKEERRENKIHSKKLKEGGENKLYNIVIVMLVVTV